MTPAKNIIARFHVARPGFNLDLDLEIPGRGVTALFGQSGSGKTTALRCMAGLERGSMGYLEVAGEVWQDDSKGVFLPTHRRPLGYVFQESSLFPHLDIRRNLEYGLKRASGHRISLDRAVTLLGIGHMLSRMPDKLSGGERQRVAIARALAVSPGLLLMDEPMASLDIRLAGEIMPYLEKLRDDLNIPIVYVSHSPDEVARLADHIVALDGGRVVAQGPLAETLARLDLPIRLGEDAGVVVDAVIGARDEAWHLIRADFAGGELWVRDPGLTVGHHVRVRILARDVSLALAHQEHTSILNLMQGTVAGIADDAHPAQSLVRIEVGGTPIISRLTKRSAAALDLAPGRPVWVQIKTAALIG